MGVCGHALSANATAIARKVELDDNARIATQHASRQADRCKVRRNRRPKSTMARSASRMSLNMPRRSLASKPTLRDGRRATCAHGWEERAGEGRVIAVVRVAALGRTVDDGSAAIRRLGEQLLRVRPGQDERSQTDTDHCQIETVERPDEIELGPDDEARSAKDQRANYAAYPE